MNGVKRIAPKARAITVVCTEGFKPVSYTHLSRASISSTSVSASSLSEARNKVVSSRSSGNGIKVISVVKK